MKLKPEEHRMLYDAINRALSEKADAAVRDRIVLRDAVCDFVSAEQARGTGLDKILQSVKEILRKAESGTKRASDQLAQQIVNWCLEFHQA